MGCHYLESFEMQFLKVYLIEQHIDEHCILTCANQGPSPKVYMLSYFVTDRRTPEEVTGQTLSMMTINHVEATRGCTEVHVMSK
jgi:hypothetical protein